ncbi:MAG: HD domain-containing protein [Candidatus Omnitrophica bacterium]|nr:HD domain-containing protein [Candidatus Omnitrophota bacterium]
MHLKNNLYSIDKKLLLTAGAKVNESTLNRIARRAGEIHYIKVKSTPLIKDLKYTFSDERYEVMLSPEETNKKILKIAGEISIPKLLLKELASIKKKLPYTYHHILIITILSAKVALDHHLENRYDIGRVMRLGLAHDIGKSRIPQQILNKTKPLTPQERKIIRMHPLLGYILLHYYYGKEHNKYDYASYEHHERLDGSGYPRKLKKINRYSQLISIIDTLDALISRRPYRRAPYTLRSAVDFLLNEAKKGRLNKRLVYLLITYARKDKPLLRGLKVSTKRRDFLPVYNVYGKTIHN